MKNKKGEVTLGIIVLLLIAVFVGLALIQAIFNQQAVLTTKTDVGSEIVVATRSTDMNVSESTVLTVANAPSGWKVNDCPLTNFVVKNKSGTTLTVTTDYVPTLSAGTFLMKNTTATNMKSGFFNTSNNNTYISYTYCPDGYNKDSGSRSIAGIIGLFAVLGLVIVIASLGIREWMD